MKQTIFGLVGLLMATDALAEENVHIPEVVDCYVDSVHYRVLNPDSNPRLEVYIVLSPKQEQLLDSFSLENPDEVFGHRLDFLLGYSLQCLEKEKKE
ncbi:MAG TPA: hypothetical protein HA360_05755 [Nanoarchaeota archaeon]|nr:hypothetical protein [Nanoarchaeota archaeon]HIH58946.1 hypothetical protein [Nanoarchaeota archaeon]HII14549.1 hypothetical protein [Nanoarchaeota archaeon]HIJ04491.1 hypothetical protein [Nanoarchaeota archaeon]